jgi:hypothetical protein
MKRSAAFIITLSAAALVAACGGSVIVEPATNNVCAVDPSRMSGILADDVSSPIDDAQVLRYAFPDPVAGGWLLEKPITSVSDIRIFNNSIFMLTENFEHCYDCILVEGATQLADETASKYAVRVDFSYQGRRFHSTALGRLPDICGGTSASALIIPGSGLNQSSAIVAREPANVHGGVVDALAEVPYIYTFVKPNEDALAWHNGSGAKLTGEMVWNYHVNRGGSYSVSYLAQSLAFVKWMKGCFGKTVVAGVSQGGAATMLNALQSKPTLAIVSSGHTLLFDQVEWSGSNQLVNVPGYARLAKASHLVDSLRNSPSKWLFTWGRGETDFYKIEADTRFTANYIEPLQNVDVTIHDGGHVFAVEEIKLFINQNLNR